MLPKIQPDVPTPSQLQAKTNANANPNHIPNWHTTTTAPIQGNSPWNSDPVFQRHEIVTVQRGELWPDVGRLDFWRA